jgi:hypothetical protein
MYVHNITPQRKRLMKKMMVPSPRWILLKWHRANPALIIRDPFSTPIGSILYVKRN